MTESSTSLEKGIKVSGLKKTFPGIEAVRGVDFSVSDGEIVGLLGPNGAGKTTTLRILAGIMRPTEGWATIEGINVSDNPFEAKRRLGFLSGNTALYERLSVRDVLRYFGRLHEMDDDLLTKRIAELTDEFEMNSFLDQRCGTLSSGQKQRANIARALCHNPQVLILDEPTTGLDVVAGHFMIESIPRAKTEGRAVLFSTHIMSEAEILCDRIVLIYEGLVLDHGTLKEITDRASASNLTEVFLRYAANSSNISAKVEK